MRNTNNRLLTNNSVGRIFSNANDTINNSINYSNTLNPAEIKEKVKIFYALVNKNFIFQQKKIKSLILEKDDEINFCTQKYEHLKHNFNDKKKNYISKIENYSKLKNSNIQLKKLINFLMKEKAMK